jgi:hypothetical protein
MMYFRFMHSQEGRLNIHTVTGHVLWLLPHSSNGFIPSVLKLNLMFLASLSKSGNSVSMFLHYDPSAGCLSIWSCLRSSLSHRINLACALILNKCFKHGIIGKYHITLAVFFSWQAPRRHHQYHFTWSYIALCHKQDKDLVSHIRRRNRGYSHYDKCEAFVHLI